MQGYVRNVKEGDLEFLSKNLRDADVAEIKAMSGTEPHEALIDGWIRGKTKVICLPDKTPCGIYGVVPYYNRFGIVWMVATDRLKEIQVQFLRESRQELREIAKGYDLLFNFTDCRNAAHHRWLAWCGFKFIKRHEKMGVEQRPFYEFVRIMEQPNV